MGEIQTHPTKRWEISLIKLDDDIAVHYKVTRRLPMMAVAETRIFSTLEEAKNQFEAWLGE